MSAISYMYITENKMLIITKDANIVEDARVGLEGLLGSEVARNGRTSTQCHRAGGCVSSRGIGAKIPRR